jgi:hypothetical protein
MFQKMATWHIHGVAPFVTLLRTRVRQGAERRPYLQCFLPELEHKPTYTGSRILMSRNVSIFGVVTAMVVLIVLGMVTVAFAAQEGEVAEAKRRSSSATKARTR